MNEKIAIFGTGKSALRVYNGIDKTENTVLYFLDNNEQKEGTYIDGIEVIRPSSLGDKLFEIDVIVICSVYFKEIEEQLIRMGVSAERIENELFFCKKKIIQKYQYTDDVEIKNIISYIKTHRMDVFNYDFVEKYKNMELSIDYDAVVGLYYLDYHAKKMYMKRSLDTYEKVYDYCSFLLMEQDKQSPHYYGAVQFDYNNKTVIDCGVAEGNFALDIIDQVKKLYLIEYDEEWIEALKYTFRDYTDKVEIIPKLLSDHKSEREVTIDDIRQMNQGEKIDFIKMDIEGYEPIALNGAEKTIETNKELQMIICVYHNDDELNEVKKILEHYELRYQTGQGYMFFRSNENNSLLKQTDNLRRGVVFVG